MRTAVVIAAAMGLAVTAAHADIVSVSISGSVVFNAIGAPPLSNVSGGDNVVMSFDVDSNNGVEGIPGGTRGYIIDQSSFALTFDTPVSVGLLDPFPAGETPYFTLVDGFPVSDGFFVSTSPISPGGVPLEQTPLQANLDLGYTGSTLSSLDILDALGTYGYNGLTRFGFNLWSISPSNIGMEIDFTGMTIVPEPTAVVLLAPLGLLLLRRR